MTVGLMYAKKEVELKNINESDLKFFKELLEAETIGGNEDIIKERGLNGNQTLYIAYQRNGMSDCPPINIQFDKQILTQREI